MRQGTKSNEVALAWTWKMALSAGKLNFKEEDRMGLCVGNWLRIPSTKQYICRTANSSQIPNKHLINAVCSCYTCSRKEMQSYWHRAFMLYISAIEISSKVR
jgi:hypothetical protein